jgi:hypothetical protein
MYRNISYIHLFVDVEQKKKGKNRSGILGRSYPSNSHVVKIKLDCRFKQQMMSDIVVFLT